MKFDQRGFRSLTDRKYHGDVVFIPQYISEEDDVIEKGCIKYDGRFLFHPRLKCRGTKYRTNKNFEYELDEGRE